MTAQRAAPDQPAPLDQSLAGQMVLVTGANRGIGQRLAAELSALGASVGAVSPNAHDLGLPRSAFARADVTDAAAARSAVRRIEQELGPIDLLINNAGSIDKNSTRLWEADLDSWWRVVETNLRGPVTMCHLVLPQMVARASGRVINISTHQLETPDPDYSAYTASKAGLHRLTEALDRQLIGSGVKVFEVAPDRHQTEMTGAMPKWDGFTDWSSYRPLTELVVAIARGQLDPWSGRWLSARRDTVESLDARWNSSHGDLGSYRRLGLS